MLNKATLFSGALGALLLLPGAPHAASIDDSKSADDAKTYESCMAQARKEPDEGFEAASIWRDHGGGFPAEHCVATALYALKQYGEAATRLERLAQEMVTETPPMRADVLSQAADAWMQADQPKSAAADLGAALKLVPGNFDYTMSRAAAEAKAKDWNGAIVDLNSVIAKAAPRGDAFAQRASAYRALGDLKDAAVDAENAVKTAPDLPEAWLERGNIRRMQGDKNGARLDWRKVLELAPDSPAADSARDNIETLELHTDQPPPPDKGDD
jgi:tetratricopeptide (TPR) repeat protein